jgi:protein disulfide-isomerase A6
LDGLAKVAAVNCDDDENKQLCGQLGVRGFPTLKIMTPSKKPGKPRTEDYQGPRSAKAIAESVVDRIPNHVKKLTDKDVDEWLSKDPEASKAILFTEKGTTSALIRAVAIDFLGSVDVAQVRNKEANAVDKFGVTEFPTIVLLPGGGKDHIVYEGELQKGPIVEFISQAATSNLDAAPKKSSKASPEAARSSAHVEDQNKPTGSPDPKVVPDDAKESKPAQVPSKAHPIATLSTVADLESACLTPKSNTCVLALLPEPKEPDSELPEPAQAAVTSLSEIAHKHSVRKTKLFPFYAVPAINEGAKTLRAGLGLPEDAESVEVIALNGRRGWWRRYDPSGKAEFGLASVERFIDSIRLGEGSKEKLPGGVIVAPKDEAEKEKQADHDEL